MSEYRPLICLPVLPLRGIVVFPGIVTHFDVGRLKSAKAVDEAMRADQRIFLTAQKDLSVDDPKRSDLYAVGTIAIIKQILRLPGDNMRILVEGESRAETGRLHPVRALSFCACGRNRGARVQQSAPQSAGAFAAGARGV